MLKILKLTDERWKQLDGSYGGVEDLLAWLHKAYDGKLTNELLGGNLDFYKGEFHYSLLDQVIPVDP